MCKVRIYDYLRVNVKTHLCVSDTAHRGENITFYKRTQIKTAAVRLPSKIPLASYKKVILSWQNITEVNVKVTVEERFSKSLKYQILNWLKYQKYQKKLIIGLVIWSDCPIISLICHHWRHVTHSFMSRQSSCKPLKSKVALNPGFGESWLYYKM